MGAVVCIICVKFVVWECVKSLKRQHHSVGTCLWHVSNALIYCCLHRNMPKAKALKNYKIVNEVKILWRLVAVGNG